MRIWVNAPRLQSDTEGVTEARDEPYQCVDSECQLGSGDRDGGVEESRVAFDLVQPGQGLVGGQVVTGLFVPGGTLSEHDRHSQEDESDR